MIKLDIYFEYPGQLQIVREAGHLVPQRLPGQHMENLIKDALRFIETSIEVRWYLGTSRSPG